MKAESFEIYKKLKSSKNKKLKNFKKFNVLAQNLVKKLKN